MLRWTDFAFSDEAIILFAALVLLCSKVYKGVFAATGGEPHNPDGPRLSQKGAGGKATLSLLMIFR
jgi:hypothetical protein